MMKCAGSVCQNVFVPRIFFLTYKTIQATDLVITLIAPLPHPFLPFLSSWCVLLLSITVQGTIFSPLRQVNIS